MAVGRRPVFILAAIIQLLAGISAGLSRSYFTFLGSVCFVGLAEGFNLSAVSSSLSFPIDSPDCSV